MRTQPATRSSGIDLQRPSGGGAVSDRAKSDLVDIIFEAVDVPIVVVGRDLKVASYNQAAANVLGLAPSHIDRPPCEIPVLAKIPELGERCADMIAGGTACRADFCDGEKSFVVRIAPCTRSDREIIGIALTFTNMTAFRASIDQAIYEREYTKAIINTVADPLVVLGADQRIQSGNRAFYAMFRASRDDTQGVSLYELGNGAFDLVPLRTQLNDVLAAGNEFKPIEINLLLPEGQRTLILDARPLPLVGQLGRKLLLTFKDITVRKAAEAANARLAAIVESSDDAILGTDLEGIITSWNSGAVRLFGYTERVMIGRSIMTLTSSDRHNEEVEILAQIRRGGRIDQYETVRRRRDGSLVDISLTVSPVKDAGGKIVGASKFARDISERKKAQLTLAERDAQLALAGKVALVGSYAYDTSTEIMQISEGYAAIHGFPEGTAEIKRSECLAGVHPDDIGRVEQSRSAAFRACGREYNVEYRIFRPRGEMRWVETRCFIAYDSERHPQRVVGVSIDITERKRAEEQQRKLVAELDHRVKNVLATVQAVAGHTMDASRSMKHFVAALDGRIRSMGSTHELLSNRRWEGVPLARLVERELAPYTTASNIELGGPEVLLSAEAGQTMAMVLHELVTNAAKYGALSVPSGRVSIRWRLSHNGDASESDRLILKWREFGGPVVVAPSRSSFGLQVVRELIPYELGGAIDHVLHPDGVRCQMEIPLAKVCVSPQNNGSASAPALDVNARDM